MTRAVTRTTVHAIVTAACGDDAADFVYDWNWLWRTEQRGHVRRGRHLIQVSGPSRTRETPHTNDPDDAALLVAAAMIEQAADDDANAMLAPRLRAEAQLLRDICSEIDESEPDSQSQGEGERNAMAAHGNRSILGPVNPYDDGAKANYVDGGQAELPSRAGQFDGITSDVSDQQSHASAGRSSETQSAFRQAQVDAGLIGADAGAGGTTVAAAGSAVTGADPRVTAAI